MASQGSNQIILLSARSPILAPLYLAKLSGGAFKKIDFEYGFELSEDAGAELRAPDPLAYKVLAHDDRKYIAGVADPFRSLIRTDSIPPRIIGGIIRHQAFWLATDDPRLKTLDDGPKAICHCSKIVTQPVYMSGYAVMADYLESQCKADPALVPDEVLFRVTKPGFERGYYKHFVKACGTGEKNDPAFAYLTTDPTDHDDPLVCFLKTKNGQMTPYHDTLMTALFCGDEWYEKNRTHCDDLAGDILKAIERIHDDPIKAAVDLKDYDSDRYMKFSRERLQHDKLVHALEELVQHNAYCTDLKISKEQVDRGVALRQPFRPGEDLPELWDHISPDIRREKKDSSEVFFGCAPDEPTRYWNSPAITHYRNFVRESFGITAQHKPDAVWRIIRGGAFLASVLFAFGSILTLLPHTVCSAACQGWIPAGPAIPSLLIAAAAQYLGRKQSSLAWVIVYSAILAIDVGVLAWCLLKSLEPSPSASDVLGAMAFYLGTIAGLLRGPWAEMRGQRERVEETVSVWFREAKIRWEISRTPLPALRATAKSFQSCRASDILPVVDANSEAARR